MRSPTNMYALGAACEGHNDISVKYSMDLYVSSDTVAVSVYR